MIKVVQCEIGPLENKVKKIILFVVLSGLEMLFRVRTFAWYVKGLGPIPSLKYTGINIIKDVKDMYLKPSTDKKKLKMALRSGIVSCVHGLKELKLLIFDCNPNQNTNGFFFTEIEKQRYIL